MRSILQKRSLRFVFAANVISMLGSGMNSAAVAWTILQRTHSEMALGTFAALQTIPAMLMLPFTGVIIDREDRRRLVMWLDALRAVVILTVTVLAFLHRRLGFDLWMVTRTEGDNWIVLQTEDHGYVRETRGCPHVRTSNRSVKACTKKKLLQPVHLVYAT